MNRPYLDPALLGDLHQITHRHWVRIVIFASLYVAAGSSAYFLAETYSGRWLVFVACLPLYVLAGASLHGISLFTHEGVHGTLSSNKHVNRLASMLCALPVLQTFAAYRVLHLRHHKHLGLPGDPDHYPNYTSWTWLEFIFYWGRLIIGYPVYITAIPILGFRHGTARERYWILLELTLLAGLITGVLLSPIPRAFLLHAWLMPMLFINTMVNIRGMSQHTLLEHHDDPVLGTRSILTNPVTAFFMCNENYHLEHHLYPGVPWYNLPRLHRLMREQLIALGAPFIPSYLAFVRDFVVGSFRRSPLGRLRAYG